STLQASVSGCVAQPPSIGPQFLEPNAGSFRVSFDAGRRSVRQRCAEAGVTDQFGQVAFGGLRVRSEALLPTHQAGTEPVRPAVFLLWLRRPWFRRHLGLR